MSEPGASRSGAWRWWICGLLLCASAINYMDRQTLANAATRISRQFDLSQEQYGNLEFGFGWAFAAGSLVFGVVVDRYPVRWVYPIVLVLWSGVGFATGLVHSYDALLVCRTFLGFFEAGHWPCAIKTTQRLLAPGDRSMGNSLLQSGTSIGAVITPLIMQWMMTEQLSSWRWPFMAVGGVGVLWVIGWFALVRPGDLTMPLPPGGTVQAGSGSEAGLWQALLTRRMLVVLTVIALINTSWQTVRAWLPKFLQEGRGYSEAAALYFNSVFYIATDVGVLGAGALTLWLCHKRFSITNSRLLVFGGCAALSATSILIPVLPAGWMLLGVLLLVGAGVLGLFPIYHAFSQDISAYHQGKVTGVAGIAAWAFAPPAQKFFGRLVDTTKSFDAGFLVAGLLPLVALAVLWLFWGRSTQDRT
jgi:ACS family hexuronate transporter-like MFS transporter